MSKFLKIQQKNKPKINMEFFLKKGSTSGLLRNYVNIYIISCENLGKNSSKIVPILNP